MRNCSITGVVISWNLCDTVWIAECGFLISCFAHSTNYCQQHLTDKFKLYKVLCNCYMYSYTYFCSVVLWCLSLGVKHAGQVAPRSPPCSAKFNNVFMVWSLHMNIYTLLPVTWQFIDAKFEGLYKSNATSHLTRTVIALST